MRNCDFIILASVSGVIFAIIVRYMNMSPAQYVFDNYGISGLIIYAVFFLSIGVFLLYYVGKIHTERRNQIQAKE